MEMKPSFRDLSCITMNFDSYCGKIINYRGDYIQRIKE